MLTPGRILFFRDFATGAARSELDLAVGFGREARRTLHVMT
jgi:hypothetical protein